MQTTDYVGRIKNKGRANEISAELDAIAEARRDVRKKWDFEGYDEYVGEVNIDRRNQDTSIAALLTNLPGSFCLYKPENNLYDQARLLEKAKKGKVLYTLKRDGIAKWVIVDYYGNIAIYTRRSRPWSDTEAPVELLDGTLDYSKTVRWAERFPHLVDAVRRLQLPNGTMMAMELVAPGEDNFPYVSGLTKGHTPRALEDMKKGGLPEFYWWDVPFFDGEDLVRTRPVRDRYNLIKHHSMLGGMKNPINPIQWCEFPTPEEAVAYAKLHGLEGWVVVDPDAVYGDKGWNLKGKPDRPSTVAKLKPWYEDDFVAMWDPDKGVGEWGTGRHERGKQVTLPNGQIVEHGGVGSMMLYQYNDGGELVPICKCASGMAYEFQAQLRKEHFPMVIEVQYAERTYISEGEKTNALRLPTFIRLRTDKVRTECVNSRL
jgi:ATP-dependent DNA ligase